MESKIIFLETRLKMLETIVLNDKEKLMHYFNVLKNLQEVESQKINPELMRLFEQHQEELCEIFSQLLRKGR